MSLFSRSSKENHYKHGNYGSSHYKKKGILGSFFSMIASGSSSSGGHYKNYRNQYNNNSMQNQPLSNQGFLKCSNCNGEIPIGSKFCLNCGEKVKDVSFCANCGEKVPPNSKFCLKCGKKL